MLRISHRRWLLLAAAVVFAAPSTASAAYVTVPGDQLHYTAAPGEVNQPVLSGDGAEIVVRDDSAEMTAGPGCEVDDTGHRATCRPEVSAPFWRARVELGDEDDRADARALVGSMLELSGGDGRDTLTGQDSEDTLDGGDGDDVLHGGGGRDLLTGGAGADELAGGDGYDSVSYSGRTDPLTADLDGLSGDGAPGENDTIGSDVESIRGGTGDDTLTGGGGNDGLSGAGGDDTLRGGAGDDSLDGGEGDDLLDGGAGRDSLDGQLGADRLSGGDGPDTLDAGEGDDWIDAVESTTVAWPNSYSEMSSRPHTEWVGCGPGDDEARIERYENPTDCERVQRPSGYVPGQPLPPSAPAAGPPAPSAPAPGVAPPAGSGADAGPSLRVTRVVTTGGGRTLLAGLRIRCAGPCRPRADAALRRRSTVLASGTTRARRERRTQTLTVRLRLGPRARRVVRTAAHRGRRVELQIRVRAGGRSSRTTVAARIEAARPTRR